MQRIGVIGAGTMGQGIIQALAQRGYNVTFSARSIVSVESGITAIRNNLEKLVAAGKIATVEKEEVIGRIYGSTDLNIMADVELVIEAITEDLEAKISLFRELDRICKVNTILSTNTETFSITEIAVATGRPDKVIGTHFLRPVSDASIVEIIKGLPTSYQTLDTIIGLIRSIDKEPIQVEEAPGYIVNRILIPMINEAICILAEGVADAMAIDKAMTLGVKYPIGPLALGDIIGLDVCLRIMESLYSGFGDTKYRPHPLLKKLVRSGNLGKKTGVGFFEYMNK